MIKNRVFLVVFSICFLIGFSFIIDGCSSEATVEQLQKIKELEAEYSSLQASISAMESEKINIDKDISFIETKLKDCETEKKLVSERLAAWHEPAPTPTVEQSHEKSHNKKHRTK